MTRSTQLLLAVAVVAGALAAYWYLALAPKREEAATLTTQIAGKHGELQQAEAIAGDYERSRSAYRRNYATVVRLGKAVPTDDDVRSLMVQLDSTSERSGVDFRTISIGGSDDASTAGAKATKQSTAGSPPPGAVAVGSAGFWALPFNLTFRGSFFRLSDFLSRVERFVTVRDQRIAVTGRLMRLETFTLKPDDEDWRVIEASIGASSYILPPSQGLTAGANAKAPAGAAGTTTSSTGASQPSTTTTTARVVR